VPRGRRTRAPGMLRSVSLPLLARQTRWSCPNCTQTALTGEPEPHARYHQCAGLMGLYVPLVADGTDCKVYATERADYVSGDLVQVAPGDGRPYMSAVVERADGSNDTVAYAPAARLRRLFAARRGLTRQR